MNITQPTSIEEYLEVVQALSQEIDSYETLALRHEIFLSITEPFVQMAWLRCAALIESEPDLDRSLSLIGAKLNNDLMEKHETLVDIQTQMFSIRFVAARLASDLSEINFAVLSSPISQDHWFWAVAIAGGLRIGSETFFNVTHNFRNPPEEIKEILPTVITKHQPIDKSLDQYKVNELNVSQPAINNSDITTANALYDLGNKYASSGQFEEALSQYEKAISIDNTNPMYYNNRASTLKRLGRINDALKQYREIIAKFPEYGKAYLSLASTHIEINNYQFSVNSYRDFLAAYQRGQFSFNPVVGGSNQLVSGQSELEIIFTTSINYLSSEQQKLALQAFNEAYRGTENNSKSSEYSYSSQVFPNIITNSSQSSISAKEKRLNFLLVAKFFAWLIIPLVLSPSVIGSELGRSKNFFGLICLAVGPVASASLGHKGITIMNMIGIFFTSVVNSYFYHYNQIQWNKNLPSGYFTPSIIMVAVVYFVAFAYPIIEIRKYFNPLRLSYIIMSFGYGFLAISFLIGLSK